MKPSKLITELKNEFQPYDKNKWAANAEKYRALHKQVHAFLRLHESEVIDTQDGSSGVIRSFRYTKPAPAEVIEIVWQAHPDMPADTILLDVIVSGWYPTQEDGSNVGSVELVTRIITAPLNPEGGYDYDDGEEMFHRVETTDEIVDVECMAYKAFTDIANTYPPEFVLEKTTEESIDGIEAGLALLGELLSSQTS